MPTLLTTLAHHVAHEYESASVLVPFLEVDQFRLLLDVLNSLCPNVRINELHGAKSFVKFRVNLPWSPPGSGIADAKCELCDLSIIWFNRRSRKARITFFQAKRSKVLHTPCRRWPLGVIERFVGNSTQWDLLNRRPLITPTHATFSPPTNLLSDALLTSVGSFGVFHRLPEGNVCLFYAAADCIDCPPSYAKSEKSTLFLHAGSPLRNVFGLEECLWACCTGLFVENLLQGNIGTPIDSLTAQGQLDTNHRRQIRLWLAAIINNAAGTAGADGLSESISSFRNSILAEEIGAVPNENPQSANLVFIDVTNASE
jgi:hypothetical protein